LKKIALAAFCAVSILVTIPNVFAQKTISAKTTKRCGTTDRVETMFRLNPSLRNIPNLRLPATRDNYRLETIATIPVVVHIVLPNPWLVTDADVQGQIDRLNLDFSGLNPDSTNDGTFTSLRGHSLMQFCLAKRTPGGQLTNGIERRASSTGSNALLASDPIKFTASGGLDVWDPNSYLNLWVGVDVSGEGILGYAQFPGTTPANEDGVFLNIEAFGSSACYTIPVYNKGRTGTHEVGHYFGLFHIWGDEAGCTGDDFARLSTAGSSVVLPANLANAPGEGNTPLDIGDTPNQAGATTSCPSGTSTDACSPLAPGKLYQDYMDYTQDACYSMFTKKQVERMEWVVNNARTGLITSLGCQPPAGTVSLDALPFQSVNPGGMEAVGCTITTYPSSLGCASSFQPKVRIKNNGLTTMTSVTAGYRYDNGAAVSNSYVVNIPAGGTSVLTLPLLSGLTPGNHALKFFTSGPNSGVDQTPGNDTLVANFNFAIPIALPLTEQFTSATFPPTGWTINNPNAGSITWARWPGTSPTGTPYSSPASAWVNLYSYSGSLGHNDYLWTPTITITNPADSVIVNFQVAHRGYLGADDTLEVVYSTNCGTSWQRLGDYYKWSTGTGTNALATVTPPCPNCIFAPSSLAQWRQERIGILPSSLGSPSSLMIGWKTINDFGNNIYIDDVNIIAFTTYTFIGTGNWSVAANWLNNQIPPSVLPAGNEIIVNPSSGNSVKDITVTLSPGSKLTVLPGKTLIIP
jgi:hypothetical protein